MALTKLTEEYLPTFIYIMDLIRNEEAYPDYKKIAKEGVGQDIEMSPRTIRRAFILREELGKSYLEKAIYIPTIKTLNALTAYYFDDTDVRFLAISTTHEKEIKLYFLKNKPLKSVVNEVFDSKVDKISLIKEQKRGIQDVLEELKEKSLEDFIGNIINERILAIKKKNNDDVLKEELIKYFEERIAVLEGKQKKASLLFRFLGSLGLFFINITALDDSREAYINDFLDDKEGLLDDDELMDLVT
ncbi:MAG: hypothetical protein COA50_16050 [Flavobacteriaceae bacterium]|nr:MAG: hypothetical protein COA50_16050 [Flavobacteriaceae bacterium]